MCLEECYLFTRKATSSNYARYLLMKHLKNFAKFFEENNLDWAQDTPCKSVTVTDGVTVTCHLGHITLFHLEIIRMLPRSGTPFGNSYVIIPKNTYKYRAHARLVNTSVCRVLAPRQLTSVIFGNLVLTLRREFRKPWDLYVAIHKSFFCQIPSLRCRVWSIDLQNVQLWTKTIFGTPILWWVLERVPHKCAQHR